MLNLPSFGNILLKDQNNKKTLIIVYSSVVERVIFVAYIAQQKHLEK